MVIEWILLTLLTLLPLVELRLSIPVGILTGTMNLPFGITLSGFGFNPLAVFFVITITNILLGIVLFNILIRVDEKIRSTGRAKGYEKFMDRSKRKVEPYIRRYGIPGLILFISLPIPGSGVYTGSLGAFMLGMRKKSFYLATAFGVTLAALIVTLITLGIHLF